MITAAISTVLGMVSGLLPDVMKEVRDSRNATRELEHLRLQAELQIKVAKEGSDSRLREIQGNQMAEEAKAFREHMSAIIESQSKPTGVAWIDGFNAVLRPTCTAMIMVLFAMTAVPFVWVVIAQFRAGAITADQMSQIIWGSLVGEAFLAALGFLFGYRSAAKRPGAIG